MSKFSKKLISSIVPAANTAGMYSAAEQLQNLTALAITAINFCADSSGNANGLNDDTAINTAGGFVKLTGSGFTSATLVYINGISVTKYYLNNTTIVATVPAATAGTTASLMVFNGSTVGSIWAAGISYSGFPNWSTTSGTSNTLTISTQLVATGDAPLTYTFVSGTLPPNCTISSSGLLSGTVTGVSTNTIYTFTVAVTDAQNQNVSQSIVYTLIVSDAYYRYNSLHITGDSIPSWITDASTSALAFTTTGVPQATTFSPLKEGYYGNSFNGGEYLTVPDSAAFTFGADDFTIECWIYSSLAGNYGIMSNCDSATSTSSQTFYLAAFGTTLQANAAYGSTLVSAGAPALTPNAWNHIAFVRNGTVTRAYTNGVQGSGTGAVGTNALNDSVNVMTIGRLGNYAALYFNGYISNLRVVKGTCLYPNGTTFTPSATPLIAVTNTVLLTCQSNRFIDNSSNAAAVTVGGVPKVSSSNPFNLPAGLVTYGAGYFNGSSYISTLSNAALAMGTGDFTIECWVNTPVVNANNDVFIELRSSGASSTGFVFNMNPTGVGYQLNFYTDGGFNLGSTVLNYNVWNHVAVTRSGTTVRLFSNGVVSATFTKANNFSDTPVPRIGSSPLYSPSSVSGSISNLRVVKGTAVYTAAFTPPTTPLTAITNTSLLTLQTNVPHNNSQFRDTSANNALISRFGNATQGSFSPFIKQYPYSTATVGGSGYFDGTGDYLTAPTNSSYGALATNFTVEAWVYPNSWPALGSYSAILYITGTSIWFGLNDIGFGLRQGGTANIISYTTKPTIGTWTHVAIARVGTTCTLYYNGISVATATSSASFSAGTAWIAADETPGNYFSGYLSNLRLVNGTAVYTSNFTPPTAPLTVVPGTALLLPFTNAAVYDNTMLSNFETIGNVQVNTSTFKYGTGSLKFNGSTDYLSIPAKPTLAFGSGNFTVEGWVYANALGSYNAVIAQWPASNGDANNSYVLESVGSSMNFYWVSGATLYGPATLGTITTGVWIHYAICRSGNTLYPFKNGVLGTTVSITQTLNSPASAITVGGSVAGAGYWDGYIDDLRVTKGYARYTAAFTPSAASYPILAPTGASILPAKSLRFRNSASAYLNKTFGVPSTQTTYTISAWIKRGTFLTYSIFSAGSASAGDYSSFQFNTNTSLAFWLSNGGANGEIVTTHLFRDPAAWYHVMVAVDTTQTVASNRMKMYINGIQITSFSTATYPTQNSTASFNRSSTVHAIGALYSGTYNQFFDGEIAELNFVDGLALDPTMFGAYSTYGQWLPVSYAGYMGANGFYLPFTNTTSTTTLGYDASGNANNWTPNNISLTAGATYDSLTDVPTLTSATAANYAVLNPLDKGAGLTLSNANLTYATSGTAGTVRATIQIPATGKYYWEATVISGTPLLAGIATASAGVSTYLGQDAYGWGYYTTDGIVYRSNVTLATYSTAIAGDVIGFAFNADAQTFAIYKNNTIMGTLTGFTQSGTYFPAAGSLTSGGNFNFGQQPFVYTQPSGFVALNTYNI